MHPQINKALLACLLLAQCSFAQDKFSIAHFGTENGLPSNGIKGLQWDEKTSFLWITTESGIVRYNGTDFKFFTNEDNAYITNYRHSYMIKNNVGKIYSMAEDGSVFNVNDNNVSYWGREKKIYPTVNNLFTLNVSEHLHRRGISPDQKSSLDLPFFRILPVHDTACLIIKNSSLYFFSAGIRKAIKVPSVNGNIQHGFVIRDMHFLIDDKKNISRFDIASGRSTPVSKDFATAKSNSFFWENGMKNPILINGKRAWKLDYADGRLIAELICDTIQPDLEIRHVQYREQSGTIFLGTGSKGIYIIKKNRLESVGALRPDAENRVSYYSQVELENGNVLTNVGAEVGKNKTASVPLPINGEFNMHIFREGDSVLWYVKFQREYMGTYLHRYRFKTRETTVFPKSATTETAIIKADNQLYVIDNKGIRKLVVDSLVLVDSSLKSGGTTLVNDVQEIEPGVLGIATCSYFFRYDVRTLRLDTIFNSSNYCVRAIWLYNGYLFFSTYGKGIYVYRNGKVKALPLDKNNYLLFAHCFMKDDYGYCWISTNRGLFKVKLDDMIDAVEKNVASIYYHYLGIDDGMVMTEMNGGCSPCALELKNKTLSFPTMDGLLWVDPRTTQPTPPSGEVYIDEVRHNNKRVFPDSADEYSIPASGGAIQVRLAYAAWSNPENIYIEYKLDNEDSWKKPDFGQEATISLFNLPHGDHQLLIRKKNGFGIDNYKYKEFGFHIATPWYGQWWFYLLSVLAVTAIVSAAVQLRIRQYKRRQRKLEKLVAEKTDELQKQNTILEKNDMIKTRLISIISHDIITPLKFLSVAGKNLTERKQMMSESLQDETIRDIISTSQELHSLSTNILNWIKYQSENKRLIKEPFNLHDTVVGVLKVLGLPANQKNIRVINAVDPNLEVRQFFEPLKILVYNIVSNAINFSEQGTITINSKKEGGEVTLSVADEGIGMTGEQVQNLMADKLFIHTSGDNIRKGNGLGYLIIKDLLKVTGASLQIESRPAAGTTVFISFAS